MYLDSQLAVGLAILVIKNAPSIQLHASHNTGGRRLYSDGYIEAGYVVSPLKTELGNKDRLRPIAV